MTVMRIATQLQAIVHVHEYSIVTESLFLQFQVQIIRAQGFFNINWTWKKAAEVAKNCPCRH